MEFALNLNKIEYCLIVPWLAFAQNCQLHGYGQYGMHGNIINVPTNLNLIQNACHECDMMIHQSLFFWKENWNTSIDVSSYVCPNIVIKVLWKIHQTPLYTNAKVSIQQTWRGLVKLVNATKPSELEKNNFENEFNVDNFDMFEEIANFFWIDTMVQNILDIAQKN